MYPKEMPAYWRANVERSTMRGVAIVGAVIEKSGHISSPSILTDPGFGMGRALLTVVEEMMEGEIQWSPAIYNGTKVRTTINFIYRFDPRRKE